MESRDHNLKSIGPHQFHTITPLIATLSYHPLMANQMDRIEPTPLFKLLVVCIITQSHLKTTKSNLKSEQAKTTKLMLELTKTPEEKIISCTFHNPRSYLECLQVTLVVPDGANLSPLPQMKSQVTMTFTFEL